MSLDQRSSLDLNTREVTQPAAETTDSIERGKPAQDSVTLPIMTRSVVPPDED